MASRKGEARAAVARRRASECLSRQNDISEIAQINHPVHKLAHRLRCSIPVAQLYFELSGLGSREALR